MGKWILLLSLVAMLVVAAVFSFTIWTAPGGAEVSANAYIAMALGVIVTMAVAIGLMSLTFYSNRHGYDESAGSEQETSDPKNG